MALNWKQKKGLWGLFVLAILCIAFLAACNLFDSSSSPADDLVAKSATASDQSSFNLGGQIIGLKGIVVLSNGEETFELEKNGSFVLSNTLISGQTFSLSVVQSPEGQECYLNYAEGVINKANISSLVVICSDVETSTDELNNDDVIDDPKDDDVIDDPQDSIPAIAHAGNNRSIKLGQTVYLDSRYSSDPQDKPIKRQWRIVQKPETSAAELQQEEGFEPSFEVDLENEYIAQLIVDNGESQSEPDFVRFSTGNLPPLADAGYDAVSTINSVVSLSGHRSTDPNGDRLSYQWAFNEKPATSTSLLQNAQGLSPSFIPDITGRYVVQLITKDDSDGESVADTVIIDSNNIAPVANAGKDQTVSSSSLLELDGSASFDVDGNNLSYRWLLVSAPAQGSAQLFNPDAEKPSLEMTGVGEYFVQLTVSDDSSTSKPDVVKISTRNSKPEAVPTATELSINIGETFSLDASSSIDDDADDLTYNWALLYAPEGSAATLDYTDLDINMLTPDLAGSYVVQLIVADAREQSEAVTLKLEALAPVVPILTVSAIGNELLETSAQASVFRISRSAAITESLDLDFTLGGTAENAVDYQNIVTSITLPAMQSFVDISIFAISDFDVEADETVTISLIENSRIKLGAQSTAMLTIIDAVPSLLIELDSDYIGLDRKVNGVVTLSAPAPLAGFSIDLSTSDAVIADVSEYRVELAKDQQTVAFEVSGYALGDADITAMLFNINNTTAIATQVTTVYVTGNLLNLGSIPVLAIEQQLSLPVSLSQEAPPGGITLNFSSSDPTIATVTDTVSIAEGKVIPENNPQVTGVGFGNASIIVTAIGYGSDNRNAKVQTSLAITPITESVPIGWTKSLTLSLDAAAPTGGATIELESSNPDVLLVTPSTVKIPQGQNQATFTITGQALGSAQVLASLLDIIATADITVTTVPNISVSPNEYLGNNLQLQKRYRLDVVTPEVLQMTVTIADASLAVVSAEQNVLGGKTANVVVNANTVWTPALWFNGLATGTTTINISIPGYNDATFSLHVMESTVRFSTSGINTTTLSANTDVWITTYLLNENGATLQSQVVRPGISVEIPLAVDDDNIGSLTSASVTIESGKNNGGTQFDPQSAGETTVTLSQPAGFISATNPIDSFVATVSAPDIFVSPNEYLGNNLQLQKRYRLAAVTPEALQMTVTIADASLAVVSAEKNVLGGETASVMVNANTPWAPTLWFNGLATGTTSVNISIPGYNDATFSLHVMESTVRFSTSGINTTTLSANTDVWITTYLLNENGATLQSQVVRPGISVEIPLAVDDDNIGSLTSASVTIESGKNNGGTQFDPQSAGETTVTLSQPEGFISATNPIDSFVATVNTAKVMPRPSPVNLSLGEDGVYQRANLDTITPQLTNATITVASGAVVQVSNTQQGVYGISTTVQLVQGADRVVFYLQGIAQGGTTVTISVPGYEDAVWDIVVN